MAGGVWVPVMASMKGFISEVNKGAGQAGKAAGSVLEKDLGAAGDRGGKSAAESMAKAMGAASSKVAAARKKEAGAASELRVAEEQLDQVRSRGDASAGEIMAAEAKVSDARRRQESMSARLGSAEQDLQTVRDGGEARASSLVSAESKVEDARLKSQAAADKIAVAEQKAQDSRESAQTASDRVKAAEDAVAQARETSGEGSREVTQAERELERARTQSDKASVAVEKAEGEVTKTRADAATASESLEVAELNVAAAQEKAAESAKDADGKISGLGDSMSGADEKAKSMNTALDKSAVAIGGVALGAAGALVKVGTDFDESFRTIRTGTGATGEAFEGLKDSALSVMDTVPAMDGGMSQISETLADLNTRLGLTDEPLETMTGQMVALSNMGVDADINAVSKAMNGFGIEAKDMPAALDELFQVSQATGLTVTDLANSAAKAGPQLRGFGFTMQDSAALVGQMDKAGLDADGTLQRLSRAMSTFADEGRDAPEALKETITSIDDFIESGNEAGAINLASDLFGTRGAAQFVDAVKSGTLSVDDFMAATGATTDTILGVSEETRTMGENFQLLKQKGETALQPIATKLVDALIPALESGAQKLEDFIGWVEDNQGLVKGLATAVGIAAAAFVTWRGAVAAITLGQKAFATATALSTGGIKAMNTAMKANVIGLIATAIAGLVAGLTWFFTKTETGQKIWQGFMDVLKGAWEWIKGVFGPVFDWLGGVISAAWEGIKSAFTAAWEVIQPVWDAISEGAQKIWENIKSAFDQSKDKVDDFGQGFREFYDTWISPVVEFLKSAFDQMGSAVTWWVDNVTKPALDILGQAFQTLWNIFIKPVWDAFKLALDIVGAAFTGFVNGVIIPAWDFLGTMIRSVWDNIINPVWEFIKQAAGLLADILTGNFDNIGNRFGDMGESIKRIVDGVIQTAMDFFKGLVDMVAKAWESFRDTVARVVGIVGDKVGEMVGKIAEIPGKIGDLFADAGEWLINAGSSIINGLWEGMQKAWDGVKNWLSDTLSFSSVGSLIGLSGGGVVEMHEGGITHQYLDGGLSQLEAYANGGGRENHTAQIAPAGAWRVWAEDETGGEAYIPLARRKRSRSTAILDEVADRFGYTLVDSATGEAYARDYQGDLGPQHVTAFADGGVVSGDDLLSFAHGNDVGGGKPSQSLEGAPYVWGGTNWGDCSGAMSAFANVAVGRRAFSSRFATGNQAAELSARGFSRGRGEPGDLCIGFVNGGPAGGHTSGTLPDGTNVEMGGGRGNGQIGGGAAGAWDSYYDTFFYLPMGPGFEKVELGGLGDLSDDGDTTVPRTAPGYSPVAEAEGIAREAAYVDPTQRDPASPQEALAGGQQVAASVFADEMGSKSALEIGAEAVFDFLGMGDSLTKKLVMTPADDLFGVPDWYGGESAGGASASGVGGADAARTSVAEDHAAVQNDIALTTMTGTEITADPQLASLESPEVQEMPEVPDWGPEFFVHEIVRNAIDHAVPAAGAKIGVATSLVEVGDPLKMYANQAVPSSLSFRHDAVGSDHDSVGLFQQRDNGAWGTVAQRMDPYDSAGMFFDEMLRKFPSWQSMDPGAVAQGVQVSAFPDRYATKMDRADALVADAGLYDAGGTIPDGGLAVNLSGSPEHVFTDRAMEDFVESSGALRDAADDLSSVAEPSSAMVPAPVAEAPSIGARAGETGGRPVTVVVNVDGDEILRKRVGDAEEQIDVNTSEIKKMKSKRRAVNAAVRSLP